MYSVEICCVATESYTVANWREREREKEAPPGRVREQHVTRQGTGPRVPKSLSLCIFFFMCGANAHTTPPPHSRVVCWWASPPSSPLEGGPPAQRHTTLRGLYRGHAPI